MSVEFDRLIAVMAKLRGDAGCAWDKKQTHQSLKPFLIEEAYEVLDAIDFEKEPLLCEELGDLLFQVVFHAQVAKERGAFDIEAILKGTTEKMTRRHPHVFSPEQNTTLSADQAIGQWEQMKLKEKRASGERKSLFDGVPKGLPALLLAHQVQAKAGRVGFDWKTAEAAFPKIEEEFQELKAALAEGDAAHLEAEIGDLLFSIVNVARLVKVNPEEALRKMVNRFITRFKSMESAAGESGIESCSIEEMERLWEEAKKLEVL
ncbi:MAG: nucleoside triphosphate pyrophosphohydrolase [Nitrospirota bacterium]